MRASGGAAVRFAVVIVLHAVAIAALAALTPRKSDIGRLLRLEVRTLPDKAQEPPKVEPPPPPPSRRVRSAASAPPAPVLAAAPEAPSAAAFSVAPQPAPAAAAPPVPIAAVPAPTPQAPPAPPPVTPARFDADYLRNPPPAYPAISRRMREEGRVLLLVQVSPQGTPMQVRIRESSGHPRLDEAALEAVRQWHFVPARRGDEPVAASVVVPLVFRID
jgi:protein TonB